MDAPGQTLDNGGTFGMNGALILNYKTVAGEGISTPNAECYNFLKSLLTKGSENRSCAEYFYRDNRTTIDGEKETRSAFGFKFVPCRNDW